MREIRAALIAILCLPLMACFEEPVQEHLHLTIRTDGSVVATVVQQVASSDAGEGNPVLADRLEEARETLAQNLDPWSQRFAQLSPLAEHQSVEQVEGEVRRSIHSAVFASFDELAPLVEEDGLTGTLITLEHEGELSLFPTGSTRATYFQRQDADRRLGDWSSQLAEYFGATIELYEHLDRQPERAVHCLAHIFDKHEGLGETGPLTPIEERLVVRAKESMEEVAEALIVPDDEAFSLNELSRLVYDPFPARLTVLVQAEVVDSIGFVSNDGSFERPVVDVWNALRSLEGRWIFPDLVTAAAAPLPEDEQPDPDIVLLASQTRRYSNPPTSAEVQNTIIALLVPEDELSLRWRVSASSSDHPLNIPSEDWLAVMSAAEASLPD
jgi:hypothetical protein